MSVLIHPSSIGKIMSEAKSIDPKFLDTPELLALYKKKSKTDEDHAVLQPLWDKTLSAGAKTYLNSIAREMIYGFHEELDVKYTRKGNQCEQVSIDLLNSVYFRSYIKHSGRIETDLLSGECDILAPTYGRDVKTSWSLATFPVIAEDAHDSGYEYQVRSYMYLYDRPRWYVDHCMVTTPEELRKYEQAELHEVDHIDPQLRVTTVTYERDLEIEARMLVKCRAAQLYIEEIKQRIFAERGI